MKSSSKIWILTGIMLALLSVVVIYSLQAMQQEQTDAFLQDSEAVLKPFAEALGPAIWLNQYHTAVEKLNSFSALQSLSGIILMSADGRPLTDQPSSINLESIRQMRENNLDQLESDQYWLIRRPIHFNDTQIATLIAAFSSTPLNERFAAYRWRLLEISAILFLLMILAALFITRSIDQPLLGVTTLLKEAESLDDLDRQLPGSAAWQRFYKAMGGFIQSVTAKPLEEHAGGALPPSAYTPFFKQSPVAMLVSETNGDISQVNPAALTFFDREEDDIIGIHLEKLIGAGDYYTIKNTIDTGDRDIEGYVCVLVPSAGQRKVCELSLSIMRDAHNLPQHYLISFIDVTEKIETQQEILANQAELSNINNQLQQKSRDLIIAGETNQQYARKLAQLIRFSQQMVQCSAISDVLKLLVQGGDELLSAEICAIFLWDAQKRQLMPVRTNNKAHFSKLLPIDPGSDGMLLRTHKSGQPYLVNALESEDCQELGLSEDFQRSLMTIPLNDSTFKYGVAAYLPRAEHLFTREDVHLLTSLSHQAAIALEKINLVQAYKERIDLLEQQNNSAPPALNIETLQENKRESLRGLVGGIAHHFNNIMGIINPNLDLIRLNIKDEENIRRRLEVIQTATRRGADLTRHLVLFAREVPLEKKFVSPNHLLMRVDKILSKALENHIKIDLDLYPSLPDFNVDEKLLSQAILNLAAHSRQHIPEGGTIFIRTAQESPGLPENDSSESEWIMISISESSSGISAGQLVNIFDPFHKTDDSTPEPPGLDLPVAYGIVKSHGGHIFADSPAGRGLRFRIYLQPDYKPEEDFAAPDEALNGKLAEPEAATVAAAEKNNRRILVIDDEMLVRESLGDLLRYLGYQVYLADSGPAGINLLAKTENIELAIIDFVMPKMDGLQTIEAIRKTDQKIKLILSTGYARQPGTDNTDINGFLPKPYQLERLRETITSILNGKPQ